MKKFLLSGILVAALSAGAAGTSYAQRNCINNNSKACRDARAAFAEHHGGVYPEKYFNHWYQGNQGRWTQEHNEWQWEGMNGDRYWKGPHGWEWQHHHHDRDHG
jgi:hypothetical protein